MNNPYDLPDDLPEKTTENNVENNPEKKANILCLISTFLGLSPLIIAIITAPIYKQFSSISTNQSVITTKIGSILSTFSGLGVIAGLVLMIYVRVKYPKNTFGKVLMILYIVAIALALIAIIVVIIACSIACGSCLEQCRGLG